MNGEGIAGTNLEINHQMKDTKRKNFKVKDKIKKKN